MSAPPLEQLDRKVLDRLDIPHKTVESPQGLSTLAIQKILNLVYLVNDPVSIRHLLDVRAAAAVGASGVTFAAPINARRLIFSLRILYVATATVGGRNVNIDYLDKAANVIIRLVQIGPTASQTKRIQMSPSTQSGETDVTLQNSMSLTLEPEWSIRVDDGNNIDNADTVAWTIQYVEIPI